MLFIYNHCNSNWSLHKFKLHIGEKDKQCFNNCYCWLPRNRVYIGGNNHWQSISSSTLY